MTKLKDWIQVSANQSGVFFAAVHWLLPISILLIGKYLGTGAACVLLAGIYFLNLPAIIPSVILWSPFYFSGDTITFIYGVISTSIFTISYEWFVIGRSIYHIFTTIDKKMAPLSIIDD